MATDFNEQRIRQPHEEFLGLLVQTMPALRTDGRIPVWTSYIMKRRINSTNTAWKDNYLFTGDLIATDGNGEYKFIFTSDSRGNITQLGSQLLGLINPNARLSNGAILLAQYDAITGAGVVAFSHKDCTPLSRDMSSEETLNSKLWRISARHPGEVHADFAEDAKLLPTYVERMNAEMKTRFQYNETMGTWLDEAIKTPSFRAWYVCRLSNWSRADGDVNLDGADGRLVGVAPEALSAQGKGIVLPTLEHAL